MLNEWWSDLKYRLRALVSRRVLDRELDDEVRFHLDLEARKLEQQGVPPAEARRRAVLAFGGVQAAKEASRDGRGLAWLDHARRDLRYAWRGLRTSPGFTVAVVATLALGLGANTAMFGIVDELLFRPPAYLRDPARVHRVFLESTDRNGRSSLPEMAYRRFLDLTRGTSSFTTTAAVFVSPLAVGTGRDVGEMPVGGVSASFFDLFDAPPVLGRYFSRAEDSTGNGAAVTVLSYGYWQGKLGADSTVIGRTVQVGPNEAVVIGITPPGFAGTESGAPPVLYLPINTFAASLIGRNDEYYRNYDWSWMQMLVRRAPDVTVAAAATDLTRALQTSWLEELALSPRSQPPLDVARPAVLVEPVLEERGPNQSSTSRVAGWVTGVTLIVLLIACANVANLLLARSLRRRREIALRIALGVSRARLAAQLLTESLLLATLGGAAGLAVGFWGSRLLRVLFLPDRPTGQPLGPRVLGLAFLATVFAGIATGLAPVFQNRRGDVASGIGGRELTPARSRLRAALLVAQAALSVVLLVGAGLFVRSLAEVRSLRLGYDAEPVVYVRTRLRGLNLPDEARADLARRLEDAARALPGIESASRALTVPFWLSRSSDLWVAGIDSVERLGHFGLQAGTADYFKTMGTRILRGRGITAEDRANTPLVMVVSEAMGQTLWPGRDPIGECVRVGADTMPCTTVVGVAENTHVRSFTSDPGLQYYLPADQFLPAEDGLLLRVRGRGADRAEEIRKQLQPLMPGTAYVAVMPLASIVAPNRRSWELGAAMFLVFGALALVIAAVGLYGVIGYGVVQRTREFGVRIALGASRPAILRMVVGDGFRFAAAGLILGGLIALFAGSRIGPLLFGIGPRDPLVFGTVTVALLVAAALASLVPAWRATRVDPNEALRSE
ncbi:MAG: ADOP family duplicated permease [Gemmatimonadales bacterium]